MPASPRPALEGKVPRICNHLRLPSPTRDDRCGRHHACCERRRHDEELCPQEGRPRVPSRASRHQLSRRTPGRHRNRHQHPDRTAGPCREAAALDHRNRPADQGCRHRRSDRHRPKHPQRRLTGRLCRYPCRHPGRCRRQHGIGRRIAPRQANLVGSRPDPPAHHRCRSGR